MPDKNCQSPTLLERTRELLAADRRSTLELHKASGLSFYWLRKIRAGVIKDPSVNSVQALYEFLSNNKLTLQ